MTQKLLTFIDILQEELDRRVIPDPGSEVARSISVLAVKQLRRLMVDANDVPRLRQAAVASYRELMPALRAAIGGTACDRLAQILSATGAGEWPQLEEALSEVTAALLRKDDGAARKLAGQLAKVDAHFRNAKEEAWIERSRPKPSRSGPAPRPEARRRNRLACSTSSSGTSPRRLH